MKTHWFDKQDFLVNITLTARVSLIEALTEDPSSVRYRNKFIVSLATYIFVNSGHRTCVIMNLLASEVSEAEISQGTVMIHVSAE